MKPGIALLVFVLIALAPLNAQTPHKKAATPVTPSPEQIAEDIQRLESELRVATMEGNAAWFEQHLAENYGETDAQGKISTRAEVIQFFRTHQPEYSSWNLSEGTARTFNGNTVILTGKTDVDGTVGEQKISGSFRFTRVWIKKGLEWQLAAQQATRISE